MLAWYEVQSCHVIARMAPNAAMASAAAQPLKWDDVTGRALPFPSSLLPSPFPIPSGSGVYEQLRTVVVSCPSRICDGKRP